MADPLKKTGNPNFMSIMRMCNVDLQNLPFSNYKCAPNVILGKCREGTSCNRDHTLPSGEEVDKILNLLDKFIKNPEDIKNFRKQGQ